MDPDYRKRLEAAGHQVFDDAADWLGLTPEERAEAELRNALHDALRARYGAQNLTPRKLATRLKTTPAHAAKIIDGAVGVSLDELFGALFRLGGTLADLSDARPPAPKRRTKKAAAP